MRSPRSASRELGGLRCLGLSTVAPGRLSSLMEIPPRVLDTRGCSAAPPRSLSDPPGVPGIMQDRPARHGLSEHGQTALRDLHVLRVVTTADPDRADESIVDL